MEGLKICWGVVRQGQLKDKVLFLKYLKLEGIAPSAPSFSPVLQNLVKHGFTMKGILKNNGSESCVVTSKPWIRNVRMSRGHLLNEKRTILENGTIPPE